MLNMNINVIATKTPKTFVQETTVIIPLGLAIKNKMDYINPTTNTIAIYEKGKYNYATYEIEYDDKIVLG